MLYDDPISSSTVFLILTTWNSVVKQWNNYGGTVWWNSGTVMGEQCGGTVEQSGGTAQQSSWNSVV